jgi:Spy/CpxP family protein refolding chaperone
MKAIRVVALGALLLVAGAVTARAQAGATQQGQAGGRRPSPLLDNMMLTDAQKAKIDGINKKYQPEMQAIFESMSNGGDRAEARTKRQALLAKMQPEIRAVLTPDQQAIFDKNAAELNARMEQMGRP